MWPRTDLIDLLGIAHPIIQAPMAGSTTPALAAAVSNAGGMGSIGCARQAPDGVQDLFDETRRATNLPFNLNFFTHEDPPLDRAAADAMRGRLAPYFTELGLGDVPAASVPDYGFNDGLLRVLLEARPAVVSFHFGLPDDAAVAALKEAGVIVLCSATTVVEARRLEATGVDAIIAQGYEAGGHRGTFVGPPDGGTVATLPLVPQIVDAVSVPVIAAGGIADGRGIAAAFALGASGVQMGTAFLTCPEASVHEVWRAALTDSQGEETLVTTVFSGRPARGIRNRFIDEMADSEARTTAFPIQYGLTAPLRAEGARRGDGDFQSMWAGQASSLNRTLPAAELIDTLVEETRAVFESL